MIVSKYDIALKELRRLYDSLEKNTSALDAKATSFLSTSSIILTIFSLIIKEKLNTGATLNGFQANSLWAIAGLLIIMLILIFFVMNPRDFHVPFSPDIAFMKKRLQGDDLDFIKKKLIATYSDRIINNEKINKNKACLIRFAVGIYLIIIALVVIHTFDFLI